MPFRSVSGLAEIRIGHGAWKSLTYDQDRQWDQSQFHCYAGILDILWIF